MSKELVRFAVIGDFGEQDNDFPKEGRVPEFVKDWDPDFIISLGDSAYSDHNANQNAFERDVLKYYGDYVKSAVADPSGTQTRFFPAIGNHDYHSGGEGIWPARWQAYQDAFAVPSGPGGHHYYEFARGSVRFFVLDSNPVEKSKYIKKNSEQWKWLDERIAAATERWKLAIFHHSPYHSTKHNENDIWMDQWVLESRGLTAAIAGHSHIYQRVMKGSFPFITNGAGGNAFEAAKSSTVPGTAVIYDKVSAAKQGLDGKNRGAILAEATADALTLEFWTVGAVRQDRWPEDAPALTRPPQPVS
jgi:hypothetical protein